MVSQLAILVVSAGITELSFSIQEIDSLLFELQVSRLTASSTVLVTDSDLLQELRHTSAPPQASTNLNDNPQSASSTATDPTHTVSKVDSALARLGAKLEAVRLEYNKLKSSTDPLLASYSSQTPSEIVFLQKKWMSVSSEWEKAQTDSELLEEELNEEKYLVIFRNVSAQAGEMMDSLEKGVTQAHQFIWDLNRREGKSSSSSAVSETPLDNQSLGSSFRTRDLEPILTSFLALQKSLSAKIKYYSPACDRVLKMLAKGIADRTTKNGEVLRRFSDLKLRWRNLLDRIGRVEGEMIGVESMLRDAVAARTVPDKGEQADVERKRLSTPPIVGGFRKFASKMRPSSMVPLPRSSSSPVLSRSAAPSTLPPKPTQHSSKNSQSSSSQAPSSPTTPVRPPKSSKRLSSAADIARFSTSHRPPFSTSPSAPSLSASLLSSIEPAPPALPPKSPLPSSEYRPRWNYSTRPVEEKEVLRGPRQSMGATPSRSATPGGRLSSMGMRSSSRMSMSGMGRLSHRPVSPAFSAYSDASNVFPRERPPTPSMIPVPRSNRKSMSHFDGDHPTPTHRRAISPTPGRIYASTQHLEVSPSNQSPSKRSPSKSRLPRRSSISNSRAESPTPSSVSRSGAYAHRSQTPEPQVAAHAKRISQAYRMSSSRPPPVPALNASYRQPPRASTGMSLRPPVGSNASSSSYRPNPLDSLDVNVSRIISSLPVPLRIERLDPPLTRADLSKDHANASARYFFSLLNETTFGSTAKRAVMVKLVDRTRGEGHKVLVRAGGGWLELETYAMSLISNVL